MKSSVIITVEIRSKNNLQWTKSAKLFYVLSCKFHDHTLLHTFLIFLSYLNTLKVQTFAIKKKGQPKCRCFFFVQNIVIHSHSLNKKMICGAAYKSMQNYTKKICETARPQKVSSITVRYHCNHKSQQKGASTWYILMPTLLIVSCWSSEKLYFDILKCTTAVKASVCIYLKGIWAKRGPGKNQLAMCSEKGPVEMTLHFACILSAFQSATTAVDSVG